MLLPLSAVASNAFNDGLSGFWSEVSSREAVSALTLTLVASLIVTLVNVVFGTLIAWVLVRDRFPGRALLNSLIDLPFALPTVVAGIVLLALYGKTSPIGINIALTQAAIVLALAFVTLPFVVRSVQPVLLELDPEVEEAAASLGAGPAQTFMRVVLPSLGPAIVSGAALSFARAIGEFGSVVLISGNIPFHTQVSSVLIYNQIESDNPTGAAAVSVLLLVIALAVVLALRALGRRSARDGS